MIIIKFIYCNIHKIIMVWKRILLNIGKFLAVEGLRILYNAVDTDKDGKLDKEEIEMFVSETRKILTDMKKRAK